jgi:hypothetical protein
METPTVERDGKTGCLDCLGQRGSA